MRLIRIGWRVFNMSALVEAQIISNSKARLYFAAPEGSGMDGEAKIEPYQTSLNGNEVTVFEEWLRHNCEDIGPAVISKPAPADDTTYDDR